MVTPKPLYPIFSPPTPEQQWALAVAAAYLSRAGTEAATRLLPEPRMLSGQIALLAGLGDTMTNAAALCETLIEVFDEWPGHHALPAPSPSEHRPTANGAT